MQYYYSKLYLQNVRHVSNINGKLKLIVWNIIYLYTAKVGHITNEVFCILIVLIQQGTMYLLAVYFSINFRYQLSIAKAPDLG